MTKKTEALIQSLAECFKAAKSAALAKADIPDGGTCNFDTPTFTIPRVRAETIRKAANIAGVSVNRSSRGIWFLNGFLDGQAARRTVMAEAAEKALEAAVAEHRLIMHTSVWYQID